VKPIDLILLAAGGGMRAGQGTPKQFLLIGHTPMMIRALAPFASLEFIGQRIVVAHPDHIERTQALLQEHGFSECRVISGGRTRQESVRLAVEHVRTPRVLTHNAAIPFATATLIRNVADKSDPCITTVTPVVGALCRGEEFAEEMVDTTHVNVINTPQSFDTDVLRDCHRRASSEGVAARTDCELLMRYGHSVRFVAGDPMSFKVTTPFDLMVARAIAHEADARSQPRSNPTG